LVAARAKQATVSDGRLIDFDAADSMEKKNREGYV
jgi:hypothetical protein